VKVDTFVLIVHFLNDKWEPCHVTIGFFETKNTFGNAMAMQINDVLAKYELNVQILNPKVMLVKTSNSRSETLSFIYV